MQSLKLESLNILNEYVCLFAGKCGKIQKNTGKCGKLSAPHMFCGKMREDAGNCIAFTIPHVFPLFPSNRKHEDCAGILPGLIGTHL